MSQFHTDIFLLYNAHFTMKHHGLMNTYPYFIKFSIFPARMVYICSSRTWRYKQDIDKFTNLRPP